MGMPIGSQFHAKFLLRNPEGKLFDYISNKFNCSTINIEDFFFKNAKSENDEGEEELAQYVRRRVIFIF
jgi:hypothetical protein